MHRALKARPRSWRSSACRSSFRLLLVLLLPVLGSPARADTITLAADEWCPYNCEPGAVKPGFMIEIAKRVFEPAGHQVVYRMMPWKRAIEETRAGKFSGIIGAYRSDAPDFVFPENALFRGGTRAFVKAGTDWRYGGLESLERVPIGVILDYSYGDEIDAYIAQHRKDGTRLQIASGDDALEKNLNKLLAGRVAVVLEDPAVMNFRLAADGKTAEVDSAGDIEESDVFIAFSPKGEESSAYAELLSDGVRKLRESGELAKILARYGL